MSSKNLKKRIIKTRWEYGMNPHSFYIYVYDDVSKGYKWDSYKYIKCFSDTKDYWFKFYWNYVRSPIIRESKYSAHSDVYDLEIEIYDAKTGEVIRKFNSRKY